MIYRCTSWPVTAQKVAANYFFTSAIFWGQKKTLSTRAYHQPTNAKIKKYIEIIAELVCSYAHEH